MAERAHPHDPGFKPRWRIKWVGGFLPVPERTGNPYREALFWRYELVREHVSGKDVLDVPCGMGWGTSLLTGCRSLIGLDISPDAIAEARKNYGEHADFRVGSMEKLDLPDASVDLVSCLEGIEHVPEAIGASFIVEARRVLRPGGRMILSSPHCTTAPHSGNPYHPREYRPEEIRQLLTPHFEIERERQREVDNLTITVFTLRARG